MPTPGGGGGRCPTQARETASQSLPPRAVHYFDSKDQGCFHLARISNPSSIDISRRRPPHRSAFCLPIHQVASVGTSGHHCASLSEPLPPRWSSGARDHDRVAPAAAALSVSYCFGRLVGVRRRSTLLSLGRSSCRTIVLDRASLRLPPRLEPPGRDAVAPPLPPPRRLESAHPRTSSPCRALAAADACAAVPSRCRLARLPAVVGQFVAAADTTAHNARHVVVRDGAHA